MFTRARGSPAQNTAVWHFAQTVTCAAPAYPPNKGLKQERRRRKIEEARNKYNCENNKGNFRDENRGKFKMTFEQWSKKKYLTFRTLCIYFLFS